MIHLESWLGLSPAPWERFTGFRTMFSGMSEAFFRLARGDFYGAFASNFLAPPLALVLIVSTLTWQWPRITSRRGELFFFLGVVSASFAVNVVHG